MLGLKTLLVLLALINNYTVIYSRNLSIEYHQKRSGEYFTVYDGSKGEYIADDCDLACLVELAHELGY